MPGGRVRAERLPEHARRVAVDVDGAVERELRELVRVARDDAGEVHHLREAEHSPPAQQRLEVAGRERAARRLEHGRGHRRRGHEEHVERHLAARVEEPVHAVGAEDVRELVRVGDDRRRPERQHEAGELVDEQLRRLDVDVRVDEARDDPAPGRVDRLAALVLAEARDVAVHDRDVGVEPLAREDREDASAADDDVGGLVPAGDGESAGEVGHAAASLPWRRGRTIGQPT